MQDWLEHYLDSRALLFHIVGRIVPPDDVEDIVQDAFLQSYSASLRYRIDNPGAYMVSTARNIALNHVRSRARRVNTSLEELSEANLQDRGCSMESEYDAVKALAIFYAAVEQLPIGCRRVFIMKKLEGLSLKAIAEKLQISPRTVEKQVSNGLARTSAHMRQEGYAPGPC